MYISMKLLFVCVGNTCRSQMAESLAKNMGFEAQSAGTNPGQKIAKNVVFDGNHRRGPVIVLQNLVQQPELKLAAQSGMDCLDLLLR